jgi:DNA-binding GntR family transcriptional regulator
MNVNSSNYKLSVYDYLKKKILNCEIMPGEDISEKDLITNSGFSRTPIREAIILLQAENLIEVIPRRGTYAKGINKKQILDLYDLRKRIEPSVAVNSRRNINLIDLIKLDKTFKDLSHNSASTKQEFCKYDLDFHSFIIASSQNQLLINMLQPIFQEVYRIGIYNAINETGNSMTKTYHGHHNIVTAILEENDTKLQNAFYAHLNQSLIATLEAIEKANKTSVTHTVPPQSDPLFSENNTTLYR